MITHLHPFLLFFCLQLLACRSDQHRALLASVDLPARSDLPSRRDLSRQIREQGEVLIAYSAGAEALRAVAERFQDDRGRIRFRAVPDKEISREILQQKVVLVLGAPATNWISGELNRQLPVQIREDAVHFSGKTFADSTLLVSLPLYPSPFNPALPVVWISGYTDAAIAGELRRQLEQGWSPLGWNSGGCEIFHNGARVLMGMFRESDWLPDPDLLFDFSRSPISVMETGHYRFLVDQPGLPAGELHKLAETFEKAADAIRTFTGREESLPIIDVHLYPSAEEKGLRLRNTAHAHIDFENGAVHLVFNDIYRGNQTGKENELLLRRLLGSPKTVALERGLAVRFTSQWQLQGYAYWAQQLFRSGNMVPLSELLDNQRFVELSSLVAEPLAASFVDFLVDRWDREEFLERYGQWRPSLPDITQLEGEWHEELARRALHSPPRVWSRRELPPLRGFNFSHEGYAIYDGYVSRKAVESLRRVADLGGNAVSIIPYSFMRNPQAPSPLPIVNQAGAENDEGVINAIYGARRLNMFTILKPQIWLGGGSWPGDVMMQNEADWQAFFRYYYEWIRHYALLAEIHQVEVLVIGTEFAKATLAREADWTTLIRKIRGLYSGKITYASNWGQEFENVGFWNELDYIGLDCYYPLSGNEQASYAELEANFRSVLKKVEKVRQKHRKPLLFTEIGFRSIPAPWRQPHAHADGAPYNGEHQRLCYEIVLKNLAGKDWCQGLLFWKWPSYLESRGRENNDYYPVGKPAEATVAEWFGKMSRGPDLQSDTQNK